eukprot:m.48568 g.48568  ORF g.48568 m.48568 type:complete len:57 (+) comp11049_c0_seq3:887-1057(+)
MSWWCFRAEEATRFKQVLNHQGFVSNPLQTMLRHIKTAVDVARKDAAEEAEEALEQ